MACECCSQGGRKRTSGLDHVMVEPSSRLMANRRLQSCEEDAATDLPHPHAGTVPGPRPHNQRHQRCFLCRVLLHLLPEVGSLHRGLLLPQELRMVRRPRAPRLSLGSPNPKGHLCQSLRECHAVWMLGASLDGLSCSD